MSACPLCHSVNAISGRGLGLTQYASPTTSFEPSGYEQKRRPRKHDSILYAARGQAATAGQKLAESAQALMQECGVVGSVSIGLGLHGLGLFSTCHIHKGQTIMSIPESACLIVDYERGISVPAEAWPRLRQGLQREGALPWDILLGLALLDALNGDGGEFWEAYAERVLPQPAALSLPFCLCEALLAELQHPDIISGALKQQERLAALLPGLAIPMHGDCETTFMQWGLASVRSRAFQLKETECFAFVPFLDIANHAPQPNSAFRKCTLRNSDSAAAIELVAVADIMPGQEAVISYTEQKGMINMRMMQQYGFVMPGGNPADRVSLPLIEHEGRQPGLSIQHLESCLGERVFVDMMGGRQPYLVAAMKSLPLREDDEPANSSLAERKMVSYLIAECSGQLEGCTTTLEEDIAALEDGTESMENRMKAVLQYRVERKLLLQKTRGLLMLYGKSKEIK